MIERGLFLFAAYVASFDCNCLFRGQDRKGIVREDRSGSIPEGRFGCIILGWDKAVILIKSELF